MHKGVKNCVQTDNTFRVTITKEMFHIGCIHLVILYDFIVFGKYKCAKQLCS